MTFADVFSNFIDTTGFAYLIADPRCLIMIAISCVLLYSAAGAYRIRYAAYQPARR